MEWLIDLQPIRDPGILQMCLISNTIEERGAGVSCLKAEAPDIFS